MTTRVVHYWNWGCQWVKTSRLRGPIIIGVLIAALAFITWQLPMSVTVYIRLFNGYIIATMLVWGFIQLGRIERTRLIEGQRYMAILEQHRADLASHRHEIIEALNHREADLVELHTRAHDLVVETARIAAENEARVMARHSDLTVKLDSLVETAATAATAALETKALITDSTEKILTTIPTAPTTPKETPDGR